ncbi:uncharacterized protein LOC131428703 [Malaya genurostris]|uniref:uncharacterized protein LOC131428703 n=1 Tax=Malaya genurostris TaxID=325434 RepID=UPI0026F3A02C|nr:uncharacterized protein LOC131428703 [Malaya genurostris]
MICLVFIYLLAYTFGGIMSTSAHDGAIVFQERDPSVIKDILDMLLNESDLTLKDHRQEEHRLKSRILAKETFHFITSTGEEFIVHSETLNDINKIEVVSNFDPAETVPIKLLLSLIGGGNVKSVTISRPRNRHK